MTVDPWEDFPLSLESPTAVRDSTVNGDETSWLHEVAVIDLRPLAQEVLAEGMIREPIVVVVAENRVLDGHHRLLVACAAGLPVIPVRHVTPTSPGAESVHAHTKDMSSDTHSSSPARQPVRKLLMDGNSARVVATLAPTELPLTSALTSMVEALTHMYGRNLRIHGDAHTGWTVTAPVDPQEWEADDE